MGIAKIRKDEIAFLKNESMSVRRFVEDFIKLRNEEANTKVIAVKVNAIGGMTQGRCINNAHFIVNNSNGEMGPAFGWVVSKNRISGQIEIIPHVFNMHYDSGEFYDFTSMHEVSWYSEKFYIFDLDMFDFVFKDQMKDLKSDLPRHCYMENNKIYSVLEFDSKTHVPSKVRKMERFSIEDFDWYWRDGREYERYAHQKDLQLDGKMSLLLEAANDDQFTEVA